MTAQAHVVQWGRTAIAFEIRRSARLKTVSIAVEPGGTVIVTAPHAATTERLQGIVRDKARWIVERRRLTEGLDPAPAREFVSGETFLYRGRQHRLRIASHSGEAEVKLEHGRLTVRLSRETPLEERAGTIERVLVAWYRARADAKLPAQVASCVQRAALAPVPIQVVAQQKRWASCASSGLIRLNWRLVQAPARLVDYVVLHELMHLRFKSHDEAFWSALGEKLPDYERRRDELRRMGPRLVW